MAESSLILCSIPVSSVSYVYQYVFFSFFPFHYLMWTVSITSMSVTFSQFNLIPVLRISEMTCETLAILVFMVLIQKQPWLKEPSRLSKLVAHIYQIMLAFILLVRTFMMTTNLEHSLILVSMVSLIQTTYMYWKTPSHGWKQLSPCQTFFIVFNQVKNTDSWFWVLDHYQK